MAAHIFIIIIGLGFLAAVVFAGFFMWINSRSARVDEKFHDHTFNPERDLAANLVRGEGAELDPVQALRAYAHHEKKDVE